MQTKSKFVQIQFNGSLSTANLNNSFVYFDTDFRNLKSQRESGKNPYSVPSNTRINSPDRRPSSNQPKSSGQGVPTHHETILNRKHNRGTIHRGTCILRASEVIPREDSPSHPVETLPSLLLLGITWKRLSRLILAKVLREMMNRLAIRHFTTSTTPTNILFWLAELVLRSHLPSSLRFEIAGTEAMRTVQPKQQVRVFDNIIGISYSAIQKLRSLATGPDLQAARKGCSERLRGNAGETQMPVERIGIFRT